MQNADWVERNRARNRDRQRQQRAAWGPLDRELASQQRRLSKYGVTIDWFHDQIARQDGRCAICRQVPTGQRPWHVDHDHATGQVRALLCSGCNTGIGHMRDNPQILRAAADYIERHSMRQAA